MRNFYKSLCGCMLFLLFSSIAKAQTFTPRTTNIDPNVGGFYEYLPKGYNPSASQTYPVILFFHGVGEVGTGSTGDLKKILDNPIPKTLAAGTFPASFTVNGQTSSFIIISPQFKGWPTDADVDAVVQYTIKNYKVDTGRVYLTGLSMGGSAVWSYACNFQYASKIAAIVPCSGGTYWQGLAGAQAMAAAHLPVLAATNQTDPIAVAQTTIDDVNLLNSLNPTPRAILEVYPVNGHDSWSLTYDANQKIYNGMNVYQWMLTNTRNKPSTSNAATPPVPTKITQYTAYLSADQNTAYFDWTTSNEYDIRHWIIQRLANTPNFVSLDTIGGAGVNRGGHYYHFIDPHPLYGSDYYRLIELDSNGKSVTYTILQVNKAAPPGTDLKLSPNPASTYLYLNLNSTEQGALKTSLLDFNGRVITSWTFYKEAYYWEQYINIGAYGLKPGTYYIQVIGAHTNQTKAFIKQ